MTPVRKTRWKSPFVHKGLMDTYLYCASLGISCYALRQTHIFCCCCSSLRGSAELRAHLSYLPYAWRTLGCGSSLWNRVAHDLQRQNKLNVSYTFYYMHPLSSQDPSLIFICDSKCLGQLKCFLCFFCFFTSQVNSYGHGGTVSSPNHTFSWASLNKQLTSTSGHLLKLVLN